MAQHTLQDLKIKQALPLDIKVNMTKARIKSWVEYYGLDGVYVSFSGGKDSTVLLNIARSIYPDIKAVFVDTGLEYPEIREFVKTFDNVEWIKPKLTFKQVIEKYGYPFISKEVAECVYGARRYLTELEKSGKLIRAEQSRAEQSRAEQSRALSITTNTTSYAERGIIANFTRPLLSTTRKYCKKVEGDR